ncbi:MAG: hypothetical protein PHR46_04220 [Candidatus Absconditabacteria bacterium]|nr:hypothetical protein [Candidatus Absconditabacteria bacterium]
MYLTDQHFFKHYFSEIDIEALYPPFRNLQILLAEYGSYKLQRPETLALIKQHSLEMYELATFLIQHRKFTKKSLKVFNDLIRHDLEQQHHYFKIISPDATLTTNVITSLETSFPKLGTKEIPTEATKLEIRGDGYSYQRSLDKDIQKIFNELHV